MTIEDHDEGGNAPVFPDGDGPASVALLEHPWSMSRHRSFIALCRGGAEHAYELRDFSPPSLFEALMGRVQSASIQRVDDYVHGIRVLSFDVPESVSPARVAAKLAELLGGKPFGFYAVVRSQNGFHNAHELFSLLRRASGNPPVVVSKLVNPMAGGGADDLFPAASTHRAISAGLVEPDKAQHSGSVAHYGGIPPCPVCGKTQLRKRHGAFCQALLEPATAPEDAAGVGPTMEWLAETSNDDGPDSLTDELG